MKLKKTYLYLIIVYMATQNALAIETKIKITVDNKTELTATLVDNSSAAALVDLLRNSPLTIAMSDYGNMEKVGPIGTTLPRNDEQITTEAGDIILYQGNALVIYYEPNNWNFTRLGKIDNITKDELKAVLGDGDITVTLSLLDNATSIKHINGNEHLFQVYPNPVKNYLEVSGTFEKILLFDNNGKQILSTAKNKIDVHNLPVGTYFLHIKSATNNIVIKRISKG